MATVEQTKKPRRDKKETEAPNDAKKDSITTEDVDGWLDEIDAVLEGNANEVLLKYIQKGGQ